MHQPGWAPITRYRWTLSGGKAAQIISWGENARYWSLVLLDLELGLRSGYDEVVQPNDRRLLRAAAHIAPFHI